MIRLVLYFLVLAAFTGLSASAAEEAKCPISGKAVDPSIHLSVNGKPIGVCCEKCQATLEKRINVKDAGPAKCQYSGEPADSATRVLFSKTEAVYFCCGKCQKRYAGEHEVTAVEDNGPGKCSYSGEPADPTAFVVHLGKKEYFCCEKCVEKFSKENHVVMNDKGPEKCAVSGEEADGDYVAFLTKTEAVYFCCEKCKAKFVKEQIMSKL